MAFFCCHHCSIFSFLTLINTNSSIENKSVCKFNISTQANEAKKQRKRKYIVRRKMPLFTWYWALNVPENKHIDCYRLNEDTEETKKKKKNDKILFTIEFHERFRCHCHSFRLFSSLFFLLLLLVCIFTYTGINGDISLLKTISKDKCITQIT